LQGHSPELLSYLIESRTPLKTNNKDSEQILTHLIDTRKEVDFIFSSEKSIEKENIQQSETFINTETEPVQEEVKQPTTGLNTNNPYNLKYQGNEAMYQIKGFRVEQLDSLKITLQIQVQ
jgi:hypothetical protein